MARKVKSPGDIKIGKKFDYLDLPENMSECFYVLKLKEAKEVGEAGNLTTVWEVLDTDTNFKIGADINKMLYPFQRLAEIFFWGEVIKMRIALGGKEVTQKRVDKWSAKYTKMMKSASSEDAARIVCDSLGEHAGSTVRCVIKSYEKQDKTRGTRNYWEPENAADE
jgi:hypothetical protein